ncbi:MAG TPA: ribosome recycling factor [Candidatus Binatia bacterium]|nr:ribosome recycling factor [Candidatus Binatia bacterium]
MTDEILKDLHSQMQETIVSLKRDMARIRAGRATPALLDHVFVDYYGSSTPLNKLATVSAPEARLLLVQPFDKSSIGAIDKAIRTSDLGLSPVSDGHLLRIPIPELTGERRKDLVKQLKKEAEQHKVSARSHRRDANDMLKEAENAKEITQDEHRAASEKVQKLTDDTIHQIDALVSAKEQEIMSI